MRPRSQHPQRSQQPLARVSPVRLDLARRWIFVMTNFQVDRNADDLIARLRRAAKAGHIGAVVADSTFARLGDVPKSSFRNVGCVKDAARDARVHRGIPWTSF